MSRQGGEQGGEERWENSGQFSAREPRNTMNLHKGFPGREMTATKTLVTLASCLQQGHKEGKPQGLTGVTPLYSRAPFWGDLGLTRATLGGDNPFQSILLPWILQGMFLAPSELGAGGPACPCSTCSTQCHASPHVVGLCRPHVPHRCKISKPMEETINGWNTENFFTRDGKPLS